ncbi:SDR family NAD(P)-dependent oxidoreductase [Chondromyces crocatus]|uniref:Short-chain dehydrogenase n=1 Tax=Chondromyces crocatus TaxID=52 RepID=A0A0K1EIP0_CHOCO|nr:SDR family oxidoreductase [Chondromyces crocatus]AKT40725.1 uncharacterized protein CMC5_048810 [Chondromyces crocatus]
MSAPRRVLVVGATGHLGSAIARALARRGDQVVLTARDAERLEALAHELAHLTIPHPPPPRMISADLRAPEGPAHLADAVLATGGLDDLVLAGGPFPRTPLNALSREALLDALTVHTVAPLLLANALAEQLTLSNGAIVALSDAGVTRPYPNHLAYLAAKGALEAGLRALATELAPRVRVNALALGIVTDPESGHDPARATRLAARTPMGRFGTPEEVAHATLALLDATWTTGEVWGVGR